MNFLFKYPTTTFRGRVLARKLKVSPTAISKTIKHLAKEELIEVKKDVVLSIYLNRENEETFILKRIANLKSLYESGIVSFLNEIFPGSAIIVFGSFSYGMDTEESDIDLAIVGYSEKNIDHKKLIKYEKELERAIQLHVFSISKNIPKHLKENIVNGIILKGALQL